MELGLGTVQFGLDYGVSNARGRVQPDEASRILSEARQRGIRLIDTAVSYGDSERVLGVITNGDDWYRIVTKLPAIGRVQVTDRDIEGLRKTVTESLDRLRCSRIYGLLAHRAEDLTSPGGDGIYGLMAELKVAGIVDKIGVSVYTADQIDRIVERYDIDLMQLPVNVFDQRLIRSGSIDMLHDRSVEIHARSIFLQGLLLMPPESMHPRFDPYREYIGDYHSFLTSHGMTPLEGAFTFVRTVPEIDVVVTGVTSVSELEANDRAFHAAGLESPDFSRFAVSDEQLVNPATWDL